MAKRSKSSARWVREHNTDIYVQKAQKEGYRSRAVYKLQEIDEKYKLFRPGMTVVDLGAAPGGWSQYVSMKLGSNSTIIALDILPMDSFADVTVLEGDFREQSVLDELLLTLANKPVDIVISDMAPNTSGIKAVDQPRAMYLAELALDFAQQTLAPGGSLLMKVFQGEGFDALLAELRRLFQQTVVRKPQASRARSKETYLLARNYRL